MNYCEYLKSGLTNHRIWNDNIEKAVIRIPKATGSKEHLAVPIKGDVNILAVGAGCNFKRFLYAELLRRFDPKEMRVTEVVSNTQGWMNVPLMSLCVGIRDRVLYGDSVDTLYNDLRRILRTYSELASIPETTGSRVEVLILDGVIETLSGLPATSEKLTIFKDVMSELYALSEKGLVKIIFIEKNGLLSLLPEDWYYPLLNSTVKLCFKTDEHSSRVVLGTDVASMLYLSNEFYVRTEGYVERCDIPVVTQEQLDNMLTNIIQAR